MLKFNKTIVTLFALSTLSSNMVFAINTNCLTCQDKVWEVSASALYLQPSFGGNGLGYSSFGNYAGADNQQVITTNNGTNPIYNITPDRAWGFQVGGAYHFCVNNDLKLDWYHLDEGVDGHLPHGTLFSGSVDGFYAGDLQLATRWDAINLEVGHEIHIGVRELLRLHAGLEYARIKNTFNNHPKLFLNSSPYFTSTDTISYTGIGPRIGADFNYDVLCGFSLYAKAAGSLLIGTAKQSINGYQNVVNNIYGTIPFGTNNFNSSDNNVLVPELEAKIGASYDFKLPRGSLGLNVGYMWITYLRAIVAYTGIGVVGSSLGVPTTTHFDLNGAYLRVSWSGNF